MKVYTSKHVCANFHALVRICTIVTPIYPTIPPSIREGNYKLRQQLKVEKAKTENAGAELRIDYKMGTISRVLGEDDEVVIFTNKHPF